MAGASWERGGHGGRRPKEGVGPDRPVVKSNETPVDPVARPKWNGRRIK